MIATSGLQVSLIDKSQDQLDKVIQSIRGSLEKLATKGKIEEDPESVLNRLITTTEMEVSSYVTFEKKLPPRHRHCYCTSFSSEI